MDTLMHSLVQALVFGILGVVLFVLSFTLLDKLTPYSLWQEIVEKQNQALAILVGAMSIGMCIIIAAAVH